MTGRPHAERGAALLTVLVAVAVLTAVAADLAYESRVSLRIAANARDELRASYQARSGIAFSRLVLEFQRQLDESTPKAAAGGMSMPRIQLWRALPVSSDLVAGLFGGGSGLFATPDAKGGSGGGLFSGSLFGPEPATTAKEAKRPGDRGARTAAAPAFDAVIEDEGTKVNAQLEGLVDTANSTVGMQLLALYQLMCDARWDPLFDREDANGVKTSREDVLVRLKEWVDDTYPYTTWELKASFGTANCTMVPALPPFVKSFGDKNGPYDRGEDRYKTKSGHLDSLDELYQVTGVGDAFMAAFRDQLTVYLPRDAKPDLNDLGRSGLFRNAKLFADQTPQNVMLLADPSSKATGEFLDRLQKALMQVTLGGILAVSPAQFSLAVAAAGVTVNPKLNPNQFTDSSATFRIKSTGTAGDVRTTVQAIVRVEKPAMGEAVGAPGRVIHWREE